MQGEDQPVYNNAYRRPDEAAIEESGLLGTHRRWTNINRYEIIFLILGVLAALVSNGLTIYRLATLNDHRNPDFGYGILLIVISIFLLIFLVTGIFQQRITDIVAFFVSAVMMTIYVVVHYILRKKEPEDKPIEDTIRLVRLIFTVAFNIFFIPFSIYVIRDYQRNEFAIRLFGAYPTARQPLKFYNIFDCIARIDTMFSISMCILNLFNFNDLLKYDQVFLGVGFFVAFIWLGLGVGMIRLENRLLFIIFVVVAFFQPAFLGYCLYSVVDHPANTSTTTPRSTTLRMGDPINSAASFSNHLPLSAASTLPIKAVLYVCMAFNILTHLLTILFGVICVRNFGKGLKERVFNSRADRLFQRRC